MSLVIEITETSPVVTEPVVTVIEVAGAGPQGAKGDTGDQGPVGPGVPAGGVEFDLIEKASGDDFDTRFTDTPTVRGLQLSTTNPADVETGRIVWNDGDEVPQFRSNGITVDLSLEMLARCRNVTGTLIPKGTAVCIVGASAQRISIAPSNRTQPGSACRTLGLTLEDIANNGFGKVSTFGLVRGLNTAAIDGDEGDELFVGETPGSLTTTPPDAPARRLTVGYLVTKSVNQGRIFVSIRRGVRVDEIDDVQVDSVADGDVIRFDDAAGRWENKPLGSAADSDAGDFDAAGSADAVQSNLETHIDDATNPHGVTKEQVGLGNVDNVSAADLRDRATHTGEQAIGTITGLQAELDDKATNTDLSNHINDDTNPHQVTAEQVGLGNVPNLDTTDAVAKAHDQNTDTALAAGTADEVTAAELRPAIDQIFPRSFGYPPQQIFAWDTFQRSDRDLHGDTLPSGQTYTVVTPSTGVTGSGQARIQGLAAERNTQAGTIDTGSALLVPRTTAVSPQSIARYIRMTFALRNVGTRPYGYFLAWQNTDNWLWCGISPTLLTVERFSVVLKNAGEITVVATSGTPRPDGRSEVAPLEISMRADAAGLRIVATYTLSVLSYLAATNTDAYNIAYTTGTLEGPNVSGSSLLDGQLFSWFAARGQL